MPIYDFQCTKCGKVEERRISFADRDVAQVCECSGKDQVDGTLVRVEEIHRTGLQFKGRWFKTTRGY